MPCIVSGLWSGFGVLGISGLLFAFGGLTEHHFCALQLMTLSLADSNMASVATGSCSKWLFWAKRCCWEQGLETIL